MPQVIFLNERNVKARMWSSSSSKEEISQIKSELNEEVCPIKLLYVTPEKVLKSKDLLSKLEKLFKRNQLKRMVDF